MSKTHLDVLITKHPGKPIYSTMKTLTVISVLLLSFCIVKASSFERFYAGINILNYLLPLKEIILSSEAESSEAIEVCRKILLEADEKLSRKFIKETVLADDIDRIAFKFNWIFDILMDENILSKVKIYPLDNLNATNKRESKIVWKQYYTAKEPLKTFKDLTGYGDGQDAHIVLSWPTLLPVRAICPTKHMFPEFLPKFAPEGSEFVHYRLLAYCFETDDGEVALFFNQLDDDSNFWSVNNAFAGNYFSFDPDDEDEAQIEYENSSPVGVSGLKFSELTGMEVGRKPKDGMSPGCMAYYVRIDDCDRFFAGGNVAQLLADYDIDQYDSNFNIPPKNPDLAIDDVENHGTPLKEENEVQEEPKDIGSNLLVKEKEKEKNLTKNTKPPEDPLPSAPKVDEPKVDEPKVDEPKVDEPKVLPSQRSTSSPKEISHFLLLLTIAIIYLQ